jgi:hypothetical protein
MFVCMIITYVPLSDDVLLVLKLLDRQALQDLDALLAWQALDQRHRAAQKDVPEITPLLLVKVLGTDFRNVDRARGISRNATSGPAFHL